MPPDVHLAVDSMSGDHGLRSTIPAARQALSLFPDLHLHLVGDCSKVDDALGEADRGRLHLEHSDDVIPMAADVATILRSGPVDSSMQKTLDLLRRGVVSAVVSAGNTVALLALAKRSVGMRPGYSRPALCSMVPTVSGECLMLDLGANVDCKPAQLLEFATMGTNLCRALWPQLGARVALLSNGSEAAKGNRQVRAARQLLEGSPLLNFCGFIEADQVQQGLADVVVCDGFVGNIALKAMEGTGRYLHSRWPSQVGNSASPPQMMNPSRHNGAFLLGLNGVVVKSHGAADAEGFHTAIRLAVQCAEKAEHFLLVGD